MKNKILLILSALIVLACGVTTLQTTTPAPTGQPTVAETRPARVKLPTTTETPAVMVICVDHANGRQIVDGKMSVINVLDRGEVVVKTGAEIERFGELWQPTDKGMIDPKLLCER